jgi:curved DNA-binding protein CbpA
MAQRGGDPYKVLGVRANASDAEVRAAYRHLVQLTHPDHNGGSPEAARRFEAVQEAYAQIRELRASAPRGEPKSPPPRADADPNLEAQLARMERDLREAHLARERARRAASEAAAGNRKRPSDEELGYVTTDDSFSKILDDASDELSKLFGDARDAAREHHVGKRVADAIDELAAKLTGERPPGKAK